MVVEEANPSITIKFVGSMIVLVQDGIFPAARP